MDPDPGFLFVGVGLCLLVLAFTSAVDAAFTSINRHRLSTLLTEGSPRARILGRLMSDPYRFKAVIILLNTGVTILATTFVLYLTRSDGIWVQVGALVALLLGILIMSESLPKVWAVRNPDATALLLAGPLSLVTQILWPIVTLVSFLTRPIVRLIGGQHMPVLPLVTEEEIRMLVNVGEEEGLFEQGEREMIEGIFTFGDTVAREIMAPRVDIVALDLNTSLEQALDTVISEGHSRIPVYNQTIDHIVGLLYAKDLLPALRDGRQDSSLRNLVRASVHFVPESMKVDVLLKEMQQRKIHMAIIVDEYGGTAGLVTIEDVIEEIVGEIQDEYDTEEPSVQFISDTELIVDARILIEDLNDQTGLHLESTDADRIGGLVYERLERVPRVGDEVVLEDATVSVLSMHGVRPEKLRILLNQSLAEIAVLQRERLEPSQDMVRSTQNPSVEVSDSIAINSEQSRGKSGNGGND